MATQDNPYGACIYNPLDNSGNMTLVNHKTLATMAAMGMTWVRSTSQWAQIEVTQGNYTWGPFDDFVTYANSLGLKVSYPILNPPTWAVIYPADPACKMIDGVKAAGWVTQLTQRYNGGSHGLISAIEYANEGYDDNTPTARDSRYLMGLNQSSSLIAQVYPVIKANLPNCLIGSAAQVVAGATNNTAHISQWVDYFYTYSNFTYGGKTLTYDKAVDYFNFHFYPPNNGGPDTTGVTPTFNQYWQAIQATCVKHNDAKKLCWLTEYAWSLKNVSQTVQDTYTMAVLDEARRSNFVNKVFHFDITNFVIPNSGGQEDQTYTDYVAYIKKYPQWGTAPTNPGQLSASQTAFTDGNYTETVTLANSAGGSSITWSVTAPGAGYVIIPSSGTLAAGATIQVVFTVPQTVQCPGTITLPFIATNNTVNVTWQCNAPTQSPGYLSIDKATLGDGLLTETVTLSNTPGASSTTWAPTSSLAGVIFSPNGDTLAGGASETVTITIPAGTDCSVTPVTLTFTGTNNTVQSVWSCTGSTGGGGSSAQAFNRRFTPTTAR